MLCFALLDLVVLTTFLTNCCSFICFPKCTRTRGVATANDALSYLEKRHRRGDIDRGRAMGLFVSTIARFRRYGTNFPDDAVVPQDPLNVRGCPEMLCTRSWTRRRTR